MVDSVPNRKRPATTQGQIGSPKSSAYNFVRQRVASRPASPTATASIAFYRPTSRQEPERAESPVALAREVDLNFGSPVPFTSGATSALPAPLPSTHAHTHAVFAASPSTPECANSAATSASSPVQPSTGQTSQSPASNAAERASSSEIESPSRAAPPASILATPGLDLLADTASRLRALHSTTDTNATTCRYYDSAAWGERWPNLLPANHAHEVEVAMAPRFRTLEGERDAPIYVDGQPLFGEEEAALVLLGMTPADGEMEVEETEE